jgi:DNA mismatch repair protein MutS2
LDQAFLANASRVRIIHGSGMGVLRRSLADLFSKHPQVQKFYPAPPDQGGNGVTIVELKL